MALVSTFAALTAATGLAGWVELSPAGLDTVDVIPLASVHMRRGEALLSGARAPSRAALAKAESEFRRALAQEPATAAAWLDLASVHRLQDGGYSGRVREAIARSYLVGPLDPAVGYWRLWFCYEGWTALPADLKRPVLREVDTLWTAPGARERLEDLVGRVGDPSGRAALSAELARLALAAPAHTTSR